ncbi:hypothetical protein [Mycolicibacterium fluoranthenivorans]|uniref:Uncharacterized protein n=1 Tax=Mycolicibacterium fluoranthenivorans TaxID=258505 RepID=A0A7X5U5P7_9MYCO|nr:hypothetical protein [Mycolicibacterium fluoranthenivorans]MCV7354519.1 hypothetical protein [Mycolicibacterium fluoranthenivorans]NIH98874.1 hypothetical protein [Mycolicibacterium fluoranthenivorans]
MSEPDHVVRQRPRGQSPSLDEVALLVRTPGRWDGYRSFTDAQRPDAEAYAKQMGVAVEQLAR